MFKLFFCHSQQQGIVRDLVVNSKPCSRDPYDKPTQIKKDAHYRFILMSLTSHPLSQISKHKPVSIKFIGC